MLRLISFHRVFFNYYNNLIFIKQKGPVSYTHLDVYKRQVYKNADELTEGIKNALKEVTIKGGPNDGKTLDTVFNVRCV